MTISSKLTIFYHNQLTTFDCPICGMRERELDGLDFGLVERDGLDKHINLVCTDCAKYLREDLFEIKQEALKFARSGMAQGSGDAEKTVGGWASMPWQVDKPAAAPAASALPTNEEYVAEKHAQNLEIECAPIVRALVEARLEDRQGLSSQDVECLEFYLKNQVVVVRP